jgi:iron complex outermembrane recepter protein
MRNRLLGQALSRTGTVANVLGAGGLLHTEMFNLKGKAALDITDWLKATYTVGMWSNDQKSNVETYLRDGPEIRPSAAMPASGAPTR